MKGKKNLLFPIQLDSTQDKNKRLCHNRMEIFILQMKKRNIVMKLTQKSHAKLILPAEFSQFINKFHWRYGLNLCLRKKHRPEWIIMMEMAGKIKQREWLLLCFKIFPLGHILHEHVRLKTKIVTVLAREEG